MKADTILNNYFKTSVVLENEFNNAANGQEENQITPFILLHGN
ncbi:MAG TPA: hypothetical protein VKA38_07475 [Draconibacterium sp.]|nr:hypothetical protein [Draconibacterium sp.]